MAKRLKVALIGYGIDEIIELVNRTADPAATPPPQTPAVVQLTSAASAQEDSSPPPPECLEILENVLIESPIPEKAPDSEAGELLGPKVGRSMYVRTILPKPNLTSGLRTGSTNTHASKEKSNDNSSYMQSSCLAVSDSVKETRQRSFFKRYVKLPQGFEEAPGFFYAQQCPGHCGHCDRNASNSIRHTTVCYLTIRMPTVWPLRRNFKTKGRTSKMPETRTNGCPVFIMVLVCFTIIK
ncbi:uncharacterized protein LOC117592707 [Drosophila guanche]|uniref:Uncharacterized protein n=1 Tax=Drosophila guanche TaxID=7266 RepID=A0A3B0JRJ2_DROGU|nr:uncharacterized protein LOC117592707 [Drosophila guanche]SPP75966.1 Hypothetical predicted protein [Drosophila guanche]